MDAKAIAADFRRIITAHYFHLAGRVGRAEFWYFMLSCLVVAVIAGLLTRLFAMPINALAGLLLLPPWTGMGARRLQDVGRDGRLVWLATIPLAIFQLVALATWGPLGVWGFVAFYVSIGWLINMIAVLAMILLIWFWIQQGDTAPNAYGPAPPQVLAPPIAG